MLLLEVILGESGTCVYFLPLNCLLFPWLCRTLPFPLLLLRLVLSDQYLFLPVSNFNAFVGDDCSRCCCELS